MFEICDHWAKNATPITVSTDAIYNVRSSGSTSQIPNKIKPAIIIIIVLMTPDIMDFRLVLKLNLSPFLISMRRVATRKRIVTTNTAALVRIWLISKLFIVSSFMILLF
jgi:hypothetical protein